jgi:hypothetical protein
VLLTGVDVTVGEAALGDRTRKRCLDDVDRWQLEQPHGVGVDSVQLGDERRDEHSGIGDPGVVGVVMEEHVDGEPEWSSVLGADELGEVAEGGCRARHGRPR